MQVEFFNAVAEFLTPFKHASEDRFVVVPQAAKALWAVRGPTVHAAHPQMCRKALGWKDDHLPYPLNCHFPLLAFQDPKDALTRWKLGSARWRQETDNRPHFSSAGSVCPKYKPSSGRDKCNTQRRGRRNSTGKTQNVPAMKTSLAFGGLTVMISLSSRCWQEWCFAILQPALQVSISKLPARVFFRAYVLLCWITSPGFALSSLETGKAYNFDRYRYMARQFYLYITFHTQAVQCVLHRCRQRIVYTVIGNKITYIARAKKRKHHR